MHVQPTHSLHYLKLKVESSFYEMILYAAALLFVLKPHVNFSFQNCVFVRVLGLEAFLVSTESLYKLYFGIIIILLWYFICQRKHANIQGVCPFYDSS